MIKKKIKHSIEQHPSKTRGVQTVDKARVKPLAFLFSSRIMSVVRGSFFVSKIFSTFFNIGVDIYMI